MASYSCACRGLTSTRIQSTNWKEGGLRAAALKIELRSFSEPKIYPGHGRPYTRTDWKVFRFLNVKCESAFLFEGNPQRINWTIHYRRKHRKLIAKMPLLGTKLENGCCPNLKLFSAGCNSPDVSL
ncbi:60S ribosomal protein L24 [Manis javanica]|nr:60S ribosomal protein L24 [Manis javanica]